MFPEIVREAQTHLTEHPFDALHGVSHHREVWENCRWLVASEGLTVDLEALEVAAWWHDVERESSDYKLLRETLGRFGADEGFSTKVVSIIEGHSFGKSQDSLEAKVLYDADKLEYLSIERLQLLLQARADGTMAEERFNYYKSAWAGRINGVRGNLNFASTRDRFEKNLRLFVEAARGIPLLADMANSVL